MNIINNLRAAQTSSANSAESVNTNSDMPALQNISQKIKQLYVSVLQSRIDNYDWPQDEYISSTLSDVINREPTLGKWLKSQTGVQLTDAKSGKAIPLESLRLSEGDGEKLFKALDLCAGKLLASDNSVAVAPNNEETQKFESFNEMLKNRRADLGGNVRLSPECEAELRQFIDASGGDVINKICASWKGENEMLQEFRKLGTNKEHVEVNLKLVDQVTDAMSKLAAGSHNACGKAANALQSICNTLHPAKEGNSVPQENGEQKMNTQAAILAFSGLSNALLAASTALSQVKQFNPTRSAGEAAALYRTVNDTDAALRKAIENVDKTTHKLCGMGNFDWMLAFRSVSNKHQPLLEAACDDINKELQRAKETITNSTQLQHSLIDKTEHILSALGNVRMQQGDAVSVALTGKAAAAQDAIRNAGTVLKSICMLVKNALPHLQEKKQLQAIQAVAAPLHEMAAVWQEMEAILPNVSTLLHQGGAKAAANAMADQLQKLISRADGTLKLLNNKADTLKNIQVGNVAVFRALKDIAMRVDLHQSDLANATEQLKAVKHSLRPEKSSVNVALKKTGEVGSQVAKKVSVVGTGLKNLAVNFSQSAQSRYLSSEHTVLNKFSEDSAEKKDFSNQLKLPVRGMQDALESLRRTVGELSAAASDNQTFGTKRGKDKLAKIEGQLGNPSIVQQAEKTALKLRAVQQKFPLAQKALGNIREEIAKARKQLDESDRANPQNKDETWRLRQQLDKAGTRAGETLRLLDNAMQTLTASVHTSPGSGIEGVRAEMTAMRIAIVHALEITETNGADAANKVLQRASNAFRTAMVRLEKTQPDREGFIRAFTRFEEDMSDKKLDAQGSKDFTFAVSVVREKLSAIKQNTAGWLNPDPQRSKNADALVSEKAFTAFIDTTRTITNNTLKQLTDIQHAFVMMTGNQADPSSKDARIIKHLANFLTSQRAEMPEMAALYDQLVDTIVDDIAGEFKKNTDPEGKYFVAQLKEEYKRAGKAALLMPQSLEKVKEKYRPLEEYLLKGGAKNLQGQVLYAALHGQLDMLLSTTMPVVTPLRIAVKVACLIKTLIAASSEMKATQMPGHPLPDGELSGLLWQEFEKKALGFLIASLPAVAKAGVRAGFAAGDVYVEGAKKVAQGVAENLITDSALLSPTAGVTYGIMEYKKHEVENTNKATRKGKPPAAPQRGVPERAVPELLNEEKLKRGKRVISNLSAVYPFAHLTALQNGETNGEKPDTLIATLNQTYNLNITADTMLDVYHTDSVYGTKQVNVRTLLENKNSSILSVRYPDTWPPEVVVKLDDYRTHNEEPEKMVRVAKQMSAEQWAQFVGFSNNTTLSDVNVTVSYASGEVKNISLFNALNNQYVNITSITYPDTYSEYTVDKLNFYLNRNEAEPLSGDALIAKGNADFQRTMSLYISNKGDDTACNELIRSGELPESSERSWQIITENKNGIEKSLSDKKSFTAVLAEIDNKIIERKSLFNDAFSNSYNQEIRNEIAYFENEKAIYSNLESEVSGAVDYLKLNPILFSEEPLQRIQQSLVVAFKLKFPTESEGLSEKQIYNKAVSILANKGIDSDKIQGLANTHQIVHYIAINKKEWKGDVTDIANANKFFEHAATINENPLSLSTISTAFSDAFKLPAPEYVGISDLKPIWEFWSETDSDFYQHIEDYKNNHAYNEAMDDVYILAESAGVYPSDLNSPPVAVKTFKIDVPVEEVRLSELGKTLTGDFNHYNTEKGSVTLFETQSGDYWSFSTLANNKTLIKIDKDTFDQYTNATEINNEADVKSFFIKTGVIADALPVPKTTSAGEKAVEITDSVLFFFYNLGRNIAGREEKRVLPTIDVEQRYHKVESTGSLTSAQNKSMNTLMTEDAAATNRAAADDKKNFSSLDRRKKPADWNNLTLQQKMLRSIGNTWAHAKDFNLALFAPVKVYIRTLEDAGYTPTKEDMAEAYFDVAVAAATLGLGAVVKSVQATKAALALVKEAKGLGLTGKSFKQFMFKGMAPFMKGAATSMVSTSLKEVFPVYDLADMATSLAKKPSKPQDISLASEQRLIKTDTTPGKINQGPDTLAEPEDGKAMPKYEAGKWQEGSKFRLEGSPERVQVDRNGSWSLVTTESNKPDTLYVFTHGSAYNEAITTPAPTGLTITFAAPHRAVTNNPKLQSVVNDEVTPYATINNTEYRISTYKDPQKTVLVPQEQIRKSLLTWTEKLFSSVEEQNRILATGTPEPGQVSDYLLTPINSNPDKDVKAMGRGDFIAHLAYNRMVQDPANHPQVRNDLGFPADKVLDIAPKMDFLYLEPGPRSGRLDQVIEIAQEKGYSNIRLTHCRVKTSEKNPLSYQVNVHRPRSADLAGNEQFFEINIDIKNKTITFSPMSNAASPMLKSVGGNEQSSNTDVQHKNANDQNSNVEESQVERPPISAQRTPIPSTIYKTEEGDTVDNIVKKYGLSFFTVQMENRQALISYRSDDVLPVGTELQLRIPQSAQSAEPVEENTLSRSKRSIMNFPSRKRKIVAEPKIDIDLSLSVGEAKNDIISVKFKTFGIKANTEDRVKNDKIKVEVYHPFKPEEIVASREFSPADVASGHMKVFIQDNAGWFREKTGLGHEITWPADYSDGLKHWLQQSFMVDQLDRDLNSPETIEKTRVMAREYATNIIELYMKTHASKNVGADRITPADLANVTQVKFCDGVIPNLFVVKGWVFSLNPNFVPVKLSDVKNNILNYPELMDEIKSSLPLKFIVEQGDNLFKTPKNIFGGGVVTRRDIIETGHGGTIEDMLAPQAFANYASDFDYTTKSKWEFLATDLAILAKIGFAAMPVWMPMLGASRAVNITIGLLSATPSIIEGLVEDDIKKSEKHFKDAIFSLCIHGIAGVISADKIAQLKILSGNTARQFASQPKDSLNAFIRCLIKADKIVSGKVRSAAEVFDNLNPNMRILMVRLGGRDVNLTRKLISDTMKKMNEEEKNNVPVQNAGPGTTKFSPADQSFIYKTTLEEPVKDIAKRLYPTLDENDVVRQIFSRNAAVLINPDKPVYPVTHLMVPNYKNEAGNIIFSQTGPALTYPVPAGKTLRHVAKEMLPNFSENDAIRVLTERNMTLLIKPNQKVQVGVQLALPNIVN